MFNSPEGTDLGAARWEDVSVAECTSVGLGHTIRNARVLDAARERVEEVRVVEQIERLDPELAIDLFVNREVTRQGQIQVRVFRPYDHISSCSSEGRYRRKLEGVNIEPLPYSMRLC